MLKTILRSISRSNGFAGTGRRRRSMAVLALVAMLVFTYSGNALAVRANPEPVTVTQPDGTKITIILKGDEYLHWNEDETGYPVLRSADGSWVYAKEELGILVPTSLVAGIADPVAEGLTKPDIRRLFEKAKTRPMMQAEPDEDIAKVPPIGTMQNLVVLVNFSDLTISNTQAEFNNLFNQIGYTADGAVGSVKDYYDEVSYNQLDVQSTVTVPVTVPNGYAYYGANDAYGNDIRPRTMVTHALAALEATGFDFSTVDGDGDGWVDGLTIIHAGGGEEFGGNDPNYIWSHQWVLSSTVTYDGTRMRPYHTEPARRGWDSSPSTWGITRIGVICHETGHFIGLPDLYDYGYDSQGTGDFCLMSGGSWNGSSGSIPSHPSAYCKVDLGWVTPTTISAGGVYPLSQVETNQQIYKLQGGFPSYEYFLVENRQGVGFDSALPGTLMGMMIWHVDESRSNNDDQTHFLVDVEEASGTQHLEQNTNSGEDSDYYRMGNVTDFSSTTTPSNHSYYGSALGLDISSVSATGMMMSFSVNGSSLDLTSPADGAILDVGALHNITWTYGGSNPDSFNIYLSIDSGSNYIYPVASGLSGASSSYLWTVPNLPVPTARIKVEAWSGGAVAAYGANGDDFAIKGKYRYVSPTGGNIYPYSIPAWAANTIQDAINAAETGDSIMVESATYNSSISVNKAVFLFGGWNPTFTLRTTDPSVTTINGTGSVVSFPSGNPDLSGIDGFTISGGSGTNIYMPTLGNYGAGVFSYESSPIIRNNRFIGCGYTDGTTFSAGGGIACYDGTVVIEDNEIDGCIAQTGGGIYLYQVVATVNSNSINNAAPNPMYTGSKKGGGIYAYMSTLTATDNVIENNLGYANGGGVYLRFTPANFSGDVIRQNHTTGGGGGIDSERGLLDLDDVTISGNITDGSGGGIYHRFGELNIDNSIIALNQSSSIAGGVYADSTWGDLVNNTIDRNRTAFAGGNLFMTNIVSTGVKNNLITYGYPNGFQPATAAGLTYQYNDAYGNNGADVLTIVPDGTNLSRDPFYADTTAMDYHLAVNSGGIDTGDPVLADLDGSRSDMGAYGGPAGDMAAPDYVTGLVASTVNDTTIHIVWDLKLPGGLDYYAVYGSTSPTVVPDVATLLGTVPATESMFEHHPVGECWYYKVSVVNDLGYGGGYSLEDGDCAAGLDTEDPVVTVTYPLGGETFAAGDTISIQWIATDNVQVDSVSILYSLNGGNDYTLIAGSEPNDSLYKWVAPEVDSDSCLVKVIAYDPGLLTGEDVCDAFFTIYTPDTEAPVVTVSYPDGGELFAAGDSIDIQWVATDNVQVDSVSIFYSLNAGADYTLIASGEPNDSTFRWGTPDVNSDSCLVRVVAYDPGLLTGSDESDGLFTISNTVDAGDTPIATFLGQNYPNPFNPTTRIVFAIGTPANVTLRIYDVAGRLVRTLVDEHRGADRYEEVWNGMDDRGGRVASGVYFYRIASGDFVKTKKMVLLR